MLEKLTELFILKGIPEHIRSDNGGEFTAQRVREWLSGLGVKTLFVERRSPWKNGYVVSFIGKLRDELLDRELFYTQGEAKVLVEHWRGEYNRVRHHSALGYRPPAPEAFEPWPPGLAPLGPPTMAPAAQGLSSGVVALPGAGQS